MAVVHPLGRSDANSQCHSAVARGGLSVQPRAGIHEKQELLFVFSLERLRKAAADCCVQGGSDRARASFLLKRDNSRSREGRARNKTPDRVLLSNSSRIRIGQPQIVVYAFLLTGLQSCFSGYFLYTGKAKSHDMPDFAWHELTRLSELIDCQPK